MRSSSQAIEAVEQVFRQPRYSSGETFSNLFQGATSRRRAKRFARRPGPEFRRGGGCKVVTALATVRVACHRSCQC